MVEVVSESWLWQLVGRLHPMVVHFPIGLLVTALFLELLTLGDRRLELRPGIAWLVGIGAVSSLAAALAGLMLAYGGNYTPETLGIHRWTGLATVVLSSVAAGLLWRAHRSTHPPDRNAYRVVLASGVVCLVVAGHYGASLTHGSDYLSSVLPWNKEGSAGASSQLLAELASHEQMAPLSEVHLTKLNTEVRRILARNCYLCHASDTDSDGGLELDSRQAIEAGGDGGPVVVPYASQQSELVARLELPAGHEKAMPQRGRPLTRDEVALIALWIDRGAYWPEHDTGVFREAPLALVRPSLPAQGRAADFDNAVDRFVAAYFEEHGLAWQEPVDDAVYMRRVYLDTIGLLPEPEELEAFIVDEAPDKREQLVARLLERDHAYAQHQLSFWNDLLRNAYTGTGFITGGRTQITDWLYASLYGNKPYNAMVRELVNPDASSEGFIRGIQWRGDFNSSQSTPMQAAQNISQSLLGVNMKCASCHNSFTSNLTLNQAYSFAAVFSDEPLAVERCEVPTGDLAVPGFFYSELGELEPGLTREQRLERMAEILVDDGNGRLYRTIVNRKWALIMGRGLVDPPDEMDEEPWDEDLLDWLASELIDQGYDLRQLMASVLTSQVYQQPSIDRSEWESTATEPYVFRGPYRRRMTAEQFADAVSWLAAPLYEQAAYVPGEQPYDLQGDTFVRASLVANDPFLVALGRPGREIVTSVRDSEPTLLQMLELTNGAALNEAVHRGADRWLNRYGDDPEELVRQLYTRAFSRAPAPSEFAVAAEWLGPQPALAQVADLLWAVFMHPEFQLIY